MTAFGAIDGGVPPEQVYADLSQSLMTGRYLPGQILDSCHLAVSYGASLKPVRECLRRFVAEGVLEREAIGTVRVPAITSGKIRELREIRLLVEELAVSRAAKRITPVEVARLRALACGIAAAGEGGDAASRVARLGEFHLGVCRACEMPHLVNAIERLWLQSGPYLKLLVPNYVRTTTERRGDWRGRLCDALEGHDAGAACEELATEVRESLEYLIALVDSAEVFGS